MNHQNPKEEIEIKNINYVSLKESLIKLAKEVRKHLGENKETTLDIPEENEIPHTK